MDLPTCSNVMVISFTLIILTYIPTVESTIDITKVDSFLETLADKTAQVPTDFAHLLRDSTTMDHGPIHAPSRLIFVTCGDMQVDCNSMLKVASFVCASGLGRNNNRKHAGCGVLEFIAAHMLAQTGLRIKTNDASNARGIGSTRIQIARGVDLFYSQFQDMFPNVCARLDSVNGGRPPAPESGFLPTACDFFRRGARQYLTDVNLPGRPSRKSVRKVYLLDNNRWALKFDAVNMMFPQVCAFQLAPETRAVPASCGGLRQETEELLSNVARILSTTVGWEVNKAVDKYDAGRNSNVKLHHVRHVIPITVCVGDARRSLHQCRYLLEDRLETLV